MNTDTMEQFIAGTIAKTWNDLTEALLRDNRKLSPARAGEIIAARLAARAMKEFAALEAHLTALSFDGEEDPPLQSIYEKIIFEDINFRSIMINLSGSRTMILDLDEALAEIR